jgi:hypothetical protein
VIAPLGGMGGRSFLRADVVERLTVTTPIGYLGDWNLAGTSIEDNARAFLAARAWRGSWEHLALTDADAAGLPRITKHDERYRARLAYESVEAEALGTTELRRRLTAWLDGQLPVGFTWAEHEQHVRVRRSALVGWLDRMPTSASPSIRRVARSRRRALASRGVRAHRSTTAPRPRRSLMTTDHSPPAEQDQLTADLQRVYDLTSEAFGVLACDVAGRDDPLRHVLADLAAATFVLEEFLGIEDE